MSCGNVDWKILQPAGDTNRFDNPSVEFNTDGFSRSNVTTVLSRDTDEAWVGCASLEAADPANAPDWYSQQALSTTIGDTYYFKVRLKGVVGQTYNVTVYNVFPANVAATAAVVGTGAWQTVTLTFVPTVNTPTYRIGAAAQAGSPFYTDGIEVIEVDGATYLDGDQDGCYWEGIAHYSASRRWEWHRGGGVILDLADYDFKVGNEQGTGIQPADFKEQDRPERPGTETTGFKLAPRVLALTGIFDRDTWETMRTQRNDLIDEISPLSYPKLDGERPQPVRWQLVGSEKTLEIAAHYNGGLEFSLDAGSELGVKERAGIRLLANDNPYWRQYPESGDDLDFFDSLTLDIFMGRVDGRWTAAGATVTTAGDKIYAVTVGQDGRVYVGGDHGDIAGVANTANAAVYNPLTETWSALDGGAIGSSTGASQTVRDILPLPDGRLIFCGEFENVDGDANADYAVVYDPVADDFAALNNNPLNDYAYDAAVDPDTGDVIIVGAFTQDAVPTTLNRVARWTGGTNNYTAVGTGTIGVDGQLNGVGVRSDGQIIVAGAHTEKISAYPDSGGDFYEVANTSGANNQGNRVIIRRRDDAAFVGGRFTQFDGEACNGIIQFGTISDAYVQWQPLGDGLTGGTEPVLGMAFTPNEDVLIVTGNFTAVEGTTRHVRTMRWNGDEWVYPDMQLWMTQTRELYDVDVSKNGDEWYGSEELATKNPVACSGMVTASLPDGASETWPIIDIKNDSSTSETFYLVTLLNWTTKQRLDFDWLPMFYGEIITVNCQTGAVTTNYLGRNLQQYIKAGTDVKDFYLQAGDNEIIAFLTASATYAITDVVIKMRYRTQYWSVDAAEDAS